MELLFLVRAFAWFALAFPVVLFAVFCWFVVPALYNAIKAGRVFPSLKVWALAFVLAVGACDSPTAPARAEFKEGARCYVVEVERPRRGAQIEYVNPCRPVR